MDQFRVHPVFHLGMHGAHDFGSMRRGARVRGKVQQRSDPAGGVARGLGAQRLQCPAEVRREGLLYLGTDVLVVPRRRREEQVIVGVKDLVRADEQLLPPVGHPHILGEPLRIGAEVFHQRVAISESVQRRLGDLRMRPPGKGGISAGEKNGDQEGRKRGKLHEDRKGRSHLPHWQGESPARNGGK
jgi:hypothetical protein